MRIALLDKVFNLLDRAAHWGVHPEYHKEPAASRLIGKMPLPPYLYLPLVQHAGAPARAVVKVGDSVLAGQLLAEAGGAISAPVHAPAAGVIEAIGPRIAPHPSGLPVETITLKVTGSEHIDYPACSDPFSLSPEEMSRRIEAAGVVGMGGATFPSAPKLHLGRRMAVHTLVINGGECEPYLSCDDRLMQERADAVIEGIRLIATMIGAGRILVGVEDNKPVACKAMQQAAEAFPHISVQAVPTRYPMGSGEQLMTWLTGKELPAGARMASIGVLIHNVGTAYAVHRAIRYGEPLTHRIVTVAGDSVLQPRNLEVAIGTPASALVEFCGGLTEKPARLVMGGPMMGMALPSLDVPVIKGCSGILALTAAECNDSEEQDCIRCGACAHACPLHLLPLDMAASIRSGDLEGAAKMGLEDCLTCGACSYICPAHLPLSHYFDFAKGERWANEQSQRQNDMVRQSTEAKRDRLAREAIERREEMKRRKAAAEAAKAAEAQEKSDA